MSTTPLKKVLIITYYWPPAGGPGVQRVLKFAKYLPEFGWQPIILTVKNGEYPAIDLSLQKEIPANCKVYNTFSLEPNFVYKKFTGMEQSDKIPVAVLSNQKGRWKKRLTGFIRLNFFIPDAKIGWKPFAVKTGKHIINELMPDLIFSSSPPPTVHLIAHKLAKWSGIKWVADFRDPWTKIHYYKDNRLSLVERLDQRLEKKVVNSSNWITAASNQFISVIGASDKENTTVITNGFDETDIEYKKNSTRQFKIVHVGNINKNRFYPELFQAVAKLLQSGVLTIDNCRICFIGKVEKSIQTEIVEVLKPFDIAEFFGYMTHSEAVQAMYSGDVLLLLLENISDYGGHIPGKLFEYLVTGNYILGIGDPKGDASAILHESGCGTMYPAHSDFKAVISDLFEKWSDGRLELNYIRGIQKYSRYELTRELVSVFEKVL